jgi:hypothetical protein
MRLAYDPAPGLPAGEATASAAGAKTGRLTLGPRAIQQPANAAGRKAGTAIESKRGQAEMISRQKEQILPATDHVLGGDWAITPLLTGGDSIGVEMAEIVIEAGYSTIGETGSTPAAYYCLSGEAIYRNLETQTTHYFRGGSLWSIPPRTRFRFTALFPIRLIAVAPTRPDTDGGADDAPYFPLVGK